MHNRTLTSPNQFEDYFLELRNTLAASPSVNVGEWQSQHDQEKFLMRELLHVAFEMPMPADQETLGYQTGARLPWAEDHFKERVGGFPLNPAPSEKWWPFRQKKDGDTNTDHKSEGEKFSHTYPERMWPKFAEVPEELINDGGPGYQQWGPAEINRGIRFDYGDLRDVLLQLVNHPFTRQAYLPIWFPEDTGAVHGKRVPCTLGYHFIIRDGKLDISYFMRSTDLLRHFQDDVYLAVRLAQWMVSQINDANFYPGDEPLKVGKLIFHTANMHIFEGDAGIIEFWKTQGKTWF